MAKETNGLKKIRIGNSNESSELSTRRRYRVKIDGTWHEGTFSKQWFGWQFDGVGSGVQLNLIDEVLELAPAPSRRGRPPKAT